jgi:hypothetical protein
MPGGVVLGTVERLGLSRAGSSGLVWLASCGAVGTAIVVAAGGRERCVGWRGVLGVGLSLDGRLCVPGRVVLGAIERLRRMRGTPGIGGLLAGRAFGGLRAIRFGGPVVIGTGRRDGIGVAGHVGAHCPSSAGTACSW